MGRRRSGREGWRRGREGGEKGGVDGGDAKRIGREGGLMGVLEWRSCYLVGINIHYAGQK